MPEQNNDEELLKMIQEALGRDGEDIFLEDSGSDGNVRFISVSRKPAGEPTFYMGEDLIVEWSEKFARERQGIFPPFAQGEKVMVSCFVGKDPDGLYRLHVDADGRVADNFFIGGVPEQDTLRSHVGMPLDVIVSVIGERKEDWRISDIWNYDAELVEVVSMPFVNPTPDEIERSRGKRVVVEGTFIEYEKSQEDRFLESSGFPEGSKIVGESSCGRSGSLTILTPDGKEFRREFDNLPKGYNRCKTAGIIETADGRKYSIAMPTGKTEFSGGVLENLRHKTMLNGDKVRIAASVNSRSGELHAAWCGPCYLDKPSEQRQKVYDDLRKAVESSVEAISLAVGEKRYMQARKMIGEVRALELTGGELDAVRDLTFDTPKPERPVQNPKSSTNPDGRRGFHVESIDDAYETRLEAMNVQEFVDFTRAAVNGERKQTGKHADTSYLFGIAEDFGVDAGTRENLIAGCIESRLPKVRGKPYDHDNHFDDKYNIEQAFKYLASLGTETSAQRLFGYMHSFVESREFDKLGWREHRETNPQTFLCPLLSAIDSHMDKIADNVLLANLGRMQKAAAILQAQSDEPFALDYLNKIIAYARDKFGDV